MSYRMSEGIMPPKREVRVDKQGRNVAGDSALTPELETRKRAELLPTTPSEDARHVLGQIALPEVEQVRSERDTPPDAAVDSIVDVRRKRELDATAVLILRAPPGKPFDGKAIWDVMLCLGLTWGDMDCFHWRNNSGLGDDAFFSVESTTPPGSFQPEEIAADRVHVGDLVFLFSVPRCAKPGEVFDAMARAAEYSRRRLGGTVIDESGDAADLPTMRKRIVDVEQRLRAAGFKPGAAATLRQF